MSLDEVGSFSFVSPSAHDQRIEIMVRCSGIGYGFEESVVCVGIGCDENCGDRCLLVFCDIFKLFYLFEVVRQPYRRAVSVPSDSPRDVADDDFLRVSGVPSALRRRRF